MIIKMIMLIIRGDRVKVITRRAWGARAPLRVQQIARTRGVKVHYTGGREDPKMLDDHELCVKRVRQIQAQHMDENDWADIAYSMIACVHGKTFMGRGPHVLTAANGAGLNTGHYSVLALVGNAGLKIPTLALLHGIRNAIDYLRQEGDAGREIKCHRDGYATDCPGSFLTAWVRDGAPRPGTSPQPQPDEEDPMGQIIYVSLSRQAGPVPIPAGQWVTIAFDEESSDHHDQHAGKSAGILAGPAYYGLSATLVLDNVGPGVEGQVRAVEVNPKKPAVDPDLGPIREWTSTDGKTYVGLDLAADFVGEGREVQIQLQHFHPAPLTLIGASVKLRAER